MQIHFFLFFLGDSLILILLVKKYKIGIPEILNISPSNRRKTIPTGTPSQDAVCLLTQQNINIV